MCTYIHIYLNVFHIWVDQRGETLASRSLLALSVWRCVWWNKLREWVQAVGPQVGGLQGYALLRWRARYRDQAVVEPCGWGYVGSHIWGVGPNRECRLLADAGGDDYQLKRIESAGITLREVFLPELEAAARRRSKSCGRLTPLNVWVQWFLLTLTVYLAYEYRTEHKTRSVRNTGRKTGREENIHTRHRLIETNCAWRRPRLLLVKRQGGGFTLGSY